jgi:murein DD-endopeptidase MepM/ murein hydrolase activator NlpD
VTSPYGYRVYPITGGWFMHNGVDLRSSCGEAQYSSAAGTVIKIGYAASNGTHGNQVIINHGVLGGRSTVTVYNHLSRFAVRYGQRVSKGQVIGNTGATGNVTGCHVHFELWLDGATVNPMAYL